MRSPVFTFRLASVLTRLVRDPSRLDVVFELSDAVLRDKDALKDFAAILALPQVGAAAAVRLTTPLLDLDKLEAMPAGSLGQRAAAFFKEHGLDPGALPRTDPTTDYEWLSSHLYETHDLWHVLTGFRPDVAGELGLQAFYAAQIPGPFPIALLTAGMINTLVFSQSEAAARLSAISRGWRMGERARLLAGLDWMKLLDRPIEDVRRELGIEQDDAAAQVSRGTPPNPRAERLAA
jgi:ubiquinone biosynthesis protein Coq4